MYTQTHTTTTTRTATTTTPTSATYSNNKNRGNDIKQFKKTLCVTQGPGYGFIECQERKHFPIIKNFFSLFYIHTKQAEFIFRRERGPFACTYVCLRCIHTHAGVWNRSCSASPPTIMNNLQRGQLHHCWTLAKCLSTEKQGALIGKARARGRGRWEEERLAHPSTPTQAHTHKHAHTQPISSSTCTMSPRCVHPYWTAALRQNTASHWNKRRQERGKKGHAHRTNRWRNYPSMWSVLGQGHTRTHSHKADLHPQ